MSAKRRRKAALTHHIRQDAQALYNQLWEVERKAKHSVAPNPVSLENYMLSSKLSETHLVAEKNDGVRCLLLLGRTHDEREEMYALKVFRNREMAEIPCSKSDAMYSMSIVGKEKTPINLYDGTLLDGELVTYEDSGKEELILFDAVAVGGYDLKTLDLHHRLRCLQQVEEILPDFGFNVSCKEFQHLSKAVEIYESHDHSDGLILMPITSPVRTGRHPNMYKWKEYSQCTIDLAWDGSQWYAIGDGGKKETNIPFRTPQGTQFITNAIYELAPSLTTPWKIVRHRTDKVYPNHIVTIKKTLNTIRDNISLDDIMATIVE
jgi:hypothetical protein